MERVTRKHTFALLDQSTEHRDGHHSNNNDEKATDDSFGEDQLFAGKVGWFMGKSGHEKQKKKQQPAAPSKHAETQAC